MRTALITSAAMIAFAANSLLCRAALRTNEIDAASFTAIRLVSGALVLALIVGARKQSVRGHGSPISAAYLAAYAIAFSFAYVRIPAGLGAILLFGAVQITMIASALVRGERLGLRRWVGLVSASFGLVAINARGAEPASLGGSILMLCAGVAWGLYSLRARGVSRPLEATAGNFAFTVPVAALLGLYALSSSPHATSVGVLLAVASGALASGLGYSLWYSVVPTLGASLAAIVQLAVPVVAAAGAVVFLDEPLRLHVALGGIFVIGGVAFALSGPAADAESPPRSPPHRSSQ